MRNGRAVGVFLVLFAGFALSPAQAEEDAAVRIEPDWVRFHAPGDERNNALAVAARGSLVVTAGYSYPSPFRLETVAYSSSGDEVWSDSFRAEEGSGHDSGGVGIDRDGNVYVGGSMSLDDVYAMALVKYDASGNRVFFSVYEPPVGVREGATALALTDDGVAVLAGYSSSHGGATLAFDPQGGKLWRTEYGRGYTHELVLDAHGNAYVTGQSIRTTDSPGRWWYGTAKYSATGEEVWFERHHMAVDIGDIARDVAVGPDGSVFVTGETKAGPRYLAAATVKYNSQGTREWARRFDAPGGDTRAGGRGVVVDLDGNAYVAVGSRNWDTSVDSLFVVKYSPEGDVLWTAVRDDFHLLTESTERFLLSPAGGLVAVGLGSEGDARLAWFGLDGRARFESSFRPDDESVINAHVAVDEIGDVYLAGTINEHVTPQTWHFFTAKFENPFPSLFFVRGDCDGDGVVGGTISDAMRAISWSFLGGREPDCLAACDANADGTAADITDAVYLLSHLFLGRRAPPAPYPHCGASGFPSDTELGCGASGDCF